MYKIHAIAEDAFLQHDLDKHGSKLPVNIVTTEHFTAASNVTKWWWIVCQKWSGLLFLAIHLDQLIFIRLTSNQKQHSKCGGICLRDSLPQYQFQGWIYYKTSVSGSHLAKTSPVKVCVSVLLLQSSLQFKEMFNPLVKAKDHTD